MRFLDTNSIRLYKNVSGRMLTLEICSLTLHCLFAVNAGSNTISSLRIIGDFPHTIAVSEKLKQGKDMPIFSHRILLKFVSLRHEYYHEGRCRLLPPVSERRAETSYQLDPLAAEPNKPTSSLPKLSRITASPGRSHLHQLQLRLRFNCNHNR